MKVMSELYRIRISLSRSIICVMQYFRKIYLSFIVFELFDFMFYSQVLDN